MNEVVLIAAVSRNGVIGADGSMPWHLPDDLRRFKGLTRGHPVVMGRRTFESIGRPLPGRTNIVLSRDQQYRPDGCETAPTLGDALDRAQASPGGDQVWIIGGGVVYREAIEHADRLEITWIDADVDGDTWFPPIDLDAWSCVAVDPHEPDAGHPIGFEFRTYRPADEVSANEVSPA